MFVYHIYSHFLIKFALIHMEELLLEYDYEVFNIAISLSTTFTLRIFQGILCVLIMYFGLVYLALV